MWLLWSLLGCILGAGSGLMGLGDLVVETSKGKISGFVKTSRDGRQYLAFTKVPFAKPPVGRLRFAPPEPADRWNGILMAIQPAPACHQPMPNIFQLEMSEDCLYLNIYKPKIEKKNLPILAYVHGGSFSMGYSGGPDFPDYLMDEDVILVTIGYRLAVLGFMSMNHTAFSGNFGLKDQVMALKWIKRNIQNFGGNPNSITVFGESAGGVSAYLLLLSPLSKDLVSRSFAISGVVPGVIMRKTPEFLVTGNRRLADDLGCKQANPSQVLDCLRAIQPPTRFYISYGLGFLNKRDEIVSPVVEPEGPGAFLPPNLHKTTSTKPLIASFSAGEHIFFEKALKLVPAPIVNMISGEIDRYLEMVIGGVGDPKVDLSTAVKKVKAAYFNNDLIHGLCMMLEDIGFVYTTMSVADTHKGPHWVLHMDHRGELTLSQSLDVISTMDENLPSHADELLYLFNARKYFMKLNGQNPEDLRVSKELIKYLVNFAYYDNPTPKGSKLPTWKPYRGNEILRIKTGRSEMADASFVRQRKDIRNFWSGIIGGPKN